MIVLLYLLSLNMELKSRQQMAKTIPDVARMSKSITRPMWNVWMIMTGVPSGGGPPINQMVTLQ